MTISEAFDAYKRDYIDFVGQSKHTASQHEYAKLSLVEFLGDIDICDLDFDRVRDWKEHLQVERNTETVRNYLMKLRVVLKHFRLREFDVMNYELITLPKRHQPKVDFLLPDEVGRMIVYCETARGYIAENRWRACAVISLLYASGVRCSELCNINVADLNQEAKTFTVRGKGDKLRLCFYDDRADYYIKKYLQMRRTESQALFVSVRANSRITSQTVQEIVRFAAKGAGIDKHVHPHTLRHSFATNLLRNNTNLLYVKEFLGHESIETTQIYTHVVNEDLRHIYREKHSV